MNDIEVFQNIKQESKNKLKEILKVKKIPKKQIIFYEREQTDKIYFIKVDSFVDTFEFLKKIEQIENPHKPNVYADYFV